MALAGRSQVFSFCADIRGGAPRGRILLAGRASIMGVEKKNIGHLPVPAKTYLWTLGTAAAATLMFCASRWRAGEFDHFLFYLACGVLCSNMKVRLPGITGTLSVNYVFIL